MTDCNIKPTVLIVDDDPNNVRVLVDILKNDFKTQVALNGEKALEVCASGKEIDLILLDVMMPGLSGFAVCKKLKNNPETSHVPIIFITALDKEGDESIGLEIGAIDYISKPFSPALVQARVRNHIELKQTRDRFEELACLDGLTGIANRRRFDETIEKEWRRLCRSEKPLSLALIDVDYFKRFNDHYGHTVGDACLRQIAKCIGASIRRPCDLAARYGGEEFVVMVPETPNSGLRTLLEKIQESVCRLAIPHEKSEIAEHVTISIGGATMIPTPAISPTSLIEAADENLYEAKSLGRNQIYIGSKILRAITA